MKETFDIAPGAKFIIHLSTILNYGGVLMYTRGQFALIGKVSVKALRLYDEMGLLKPVHIDQNNQYKYYSPKQIDDIIFINELKSFGYSLEEIKETLDRNDKNFLIESLSTKLSIIDNDIMEHHRIKDAIFQKIETLTDIKSGDNNVLNYGVALTKLDDIIVVSCSDKLNIQDVGRLIGRAYEIISKLSLEAIDSHMIISNNYGSESMDDDWNIEVCIPVNKQSMNESQSTKLLEGKTYAKTLHTGGFKEIGKAHAAIIDWIAENGYEICGSPIEKYLTANQAVFNPSSFKIEVLYPVQRV